MTLEERLRNELSILIILVPTWEHASLACMRNFDRTKEVEYFAEANQWFYKAVGGREKMEFIGSLLKEYFDADAN